MWTLIMNWLSVVDYLTSSPYDDGSMTCPLTLLLINRGNHRQEFRFIREIAVYIAIVFFSRNSFFSFFYKFFGGHKCFLWGHRYPCRFGLLVTSPWVSKPAWIPRLHALSPVCNGFLKFTSSVTPANFLTASMAASHIPYMHVAEVGCWDLIGRPPAQ